MNLIHPDPECDLFADLSLDLRKEVRSWLRAFEKADFSAGVGKAIDRVANMMRVSPQTARRYYDRLVHGGGRWEAIVDGRRIKPITGDSLTSRKEFRQFITALAERHQRKSKPAYRKFLNAWASREAIPGAEDFPGWPEPPFSYRTFCRILKNETNQQKLRSIRVGTTSKTGVDLAQVFTTRNGLHVGAVFQIDDMWHDNWVMYGNDPKPRRVMELGILDLFSGCRPHWGCMPRLENEAGGMRNIRGPEMRQFMAGFLWNFGVHPAGTRFMLEHGTAALPPDVIELLNSCGLNIQIDLQPIEGRQNALLNYWGSSQGGNFHAKAALESLHNLLHNELGHLALQTGSHHSGLQGPLTTDPKLKWIESTLRAIAKNAPHRLDLFRKMGALDFHSEFIPLINDIYTFGINGRTDHNLEGWEKLGFIRTEYTAAPGSGHYLTDSSFLALPKASQFAITEAAKQDPKNWMRRRKLSPMEVWNSGKSQLRPVAAPIICDILGRDLAREVKVKGAYIRFYDKDIAPDELIYEARATFLNGAQRELSSGEKFSAMVLPFCPKHLFLLDAKDKYFGHCELVQRHTANDRVALIAAAGHKAHRNAEIHEPLRVRHAEMVNQEAAERAYNNRLADPMQPVTEEEKSEARSAAGHRGQITAANNRLAKHGAAPDWDHVSQPASLDPFAGIPDDTELPDAL